MKIHKNQ